MTKKIVNPYLTTPRKEYNCFGCSPNNEKGLQLKFELDGEEVVARWNPQRWAEGFQECIARGHPGCLARRALQLGSPDALQNGRGNHFDGD